MESSEDAEHKTNTPASREGDRANAERLFAQSQSALEAGGPTNWGTAEEEEIARAAYRAWAAEIAAVGIARKLLFHEQLGEISEDFAASLSQSLPAGMKARAIEGHLYVWRTASLPVSIEEAHRLSVENRNGLLLGYGAPEMNLPGHVKVYLLDARGDLVAGFHTAPEGAEAIAEERARDYADAWGETITAQIVR